LKTIIRNARVICPGSILEDGWVAIEDGLIREMGSGACPTEAETTVDAGGAYLSPGFVDVHVHGGGGGDFCDGSLDAWLTVLHTHLAGGTTTIAPTLMSTSLQGILDNSQIYMELHKTWEQHPGIPHLGGMHLEGPYFSQAQLGAQDVRHVRDPNPEEYEIILAANPYIRRWAAACELPGALAFGDRLARDGIVACIGHSNATTAQVMEAVQHGYRCVTHLYSGCSVLHRNGPYREGGVVEAAFLLDDLDVEVIGDGIHLPPDFLKLIYKIKGPDHMVLITDCIRPGGQNLPEHTVSYSDREKQRPVILESGVAVMPDHQAFAGSIVTMCRVVQVAVQQVGIPLWEAVRMAALNPARMLGLENRIGSITPGKQADLLLLDQNLQVQRVFLSGLEVADPWMPPAARGEGGAL
jgi:N-acetylglucosamine-6-phosphate deacetylase